MLLIVSKTIIIMALIIKHYINSIIFINEKASKLFCIVDDKH